MPVPYKLLGFHHINQRSRAPSCRKKMLYVGRQPEIGSLPYTRQLKNTDKPPAKLRLLITDEFQSRYSRQRKQRKHQATIYGRKYLDCIFLKPTKSHDHLRMCPPYFECCRESALQLISGSGYVLICVLYTSQWAPISGSGCINLRVIFYKPVGARSSETLCWGN